jgi:PAS domain S-box-containing protein
MSANGLKHTAHDTVGGYPDEKELARLLLDSVEDYAIYLLDRQGKILTWNTGAARLTGYAREEVIGQDFGMLFPPEECAAGKPQALLVTAAERGNAGEEGWRQRKNGSLFWADATVTPVTDASGALIGYAKVTRNRTERKNHEEHIGRLNRLYAVLSDINHAIVRTRELEVLYAQACRIIVEKGGLSLAWICLLDAGTGQLSLVGSAGIDVQDLALLAEHVRNGLPAHSLTLEAIRTSCEASKDDILAPASGDVWLPFGSRREYRSYAAFPLLRNGRAVGALTLSAAAPNFFDGELRHLVTELAADLVFAMEVDAAEQQRQQVVQELQASAARYRSLIEHSPDAVFVNHEDRVVLVNGACVQLFGGTGAADLVGKSIFDLIAPECHPLIQQQLEQLYTGQEPLPAVEEQIVRLDGTRVDVEIKAAPFPYSGSTAIHVIIRDITQRKHSEAELRQLNAELEQHVVDRTVELEARNRELETFTYSVSHDLKAPLRGIDGYSRMLQEDFADRLDDEGRRYIATIRGATQQMNQLIEDLLAYSRLERRKLRSSPISPQAMMNTLLLEYRDEIERRGVNVRLTLPEVTLHVDPEGLAMALRNLFDNALKFSAAASHPEIEIGGAAAGAMFRLWVRDNGIGFAMKYHDRIFEIFQRLHRTEEYAGTGVGLAIVHKAIERMGGRVWAESESGNGATFYLEVPYGNAETP